MIEAMRSSLAAKVIRCERSNADDTLFGVEARRVGEAGVLQAELDRLLVHPLDEGRGAAVRGARERARGAVVGRRSAAGAAARPR